MTEDYKALNQAIVKKVRELMRRDSINVSKLSQLSDRTNPTITKWLSGDYDFKFSDIEILQKIFNDEIVKITIKEQVVKHEEKEYKFTNNVQKSTLSLEK